MICSNIIKINKNDLQNKDSSNLVEKENSDKEDTEQELQKVNDNLDDIMNENFALHESVKLLKDRLLKLDEYSCNLSRDSKNKSDFMSMLSHELRTSLNCIMSFSDMIRSEMLGQIDNKKYLEYAQDIYDSSTHMLLIINNILDISKAEAGKLELNESIVNIKDLINFAIKNVSNMANRKNINIKKFYERGTENIFIDELLFRQIMINLLSNSIKFSNKNDEVNIEVYKNDNGLYISVIDNGIGISEENIPLVLEKFNQEKHEKLNVKGTGIGLPLVKILVELHNGILKIESKKGEGTKVTIQLSLDLIR